MNFFLKRILIPIICVIWLTGDFLGLTGNWSPDGETFQHNLFYYVVVFAVYSSLLYGAVAGLPEKYRLVGACAYLLGGMLEFIGTSNNTDSYLIIAKVLWICGCIFLVFHSWLRSRTPKDGIAYR